MVWNKDENIKDLWEETEDETEEQPQPVEEAEQTEEIEQMEEPVEEVEEPTVSEPVVEQPKHEVQKTPAPVHAARQITKREQKHQQRIEQKKEENQTNKEPKHSKWGKFKDFATECKRVLRITKKPTREEFKTIVKVSGLGIAIIGLIGFVIFFIKELFLK